MPVKTHLEYSLDPSSFSALKTVVAIGRAAQLQGAAADLGVPEDTWAAMLASVSPGDAGDAAVTWVGARKIVAGVLPEPCSRHNSPSRAWAIPGLAKRAGGAGDAGVVLYLSDADHAFASALACARAFPLYAATSGETTERTVTIAALGPDGPVDDARVPHGIEGTRFAARLVDAPTSELNTDDFVAEAEAVAAELGCGIEVIRGEALRDGGFGGLWGVGKAAVHGPALVALTHAPEGAGRSVAWVGKGIVYDTGGLSIKGKAGMPGMKGDMGGAAAVLAAFRAAVKAGADYRIVAVLCLAENSVGPESTRPDDVLYMRSGKTVEVNNTDAEGRLVLADGVAWVCETHGPDVLVDLATLTGAALVATGKVHAGIYCNDEDLERAAVAAGKRAGEPVHPFVYAPELFRKEFKSPVADMKNSVKDRGNAQSSCAGQFIGNHLPADPPAWLHVDIAGPSSDASDRGTGFGVGLLMELGGAG